MDRAIPLELRLLPQWVGWRYQIRKGKRTKVPINVRTKSFASSTNQNTWSSYAIAYYSVNNQYRWLDGTGFVFTTEDSYYGIDLDNCIHNGRFTALADEIVTEFNTYTEISPSEKGLKLFCKTNSKQPSIFMKKNGWPIEIYSTSRMFTVTGIHVEYTPRYCTKNDTALAKLVNRITTTNADGSPIQRPQQVNYSGESSSSTNEIIANIINSKAAKRFLPLLKGDWTKYPSPSEADLALMNILAYFTEGDLQVMLSVAYATELNRPKWNRYSHSNNCSYIEQVATIALTGEQYG